jgi:SAM-dependent methyltransferase
MSARLYDLVQNLAGFRTTSHRYRAALAPLAHKTVLDVGGGTGLIGSLLPPTATYICVDADRRKLAGLARRLPHARGILGDATRLDFPDRSVDWALCFALSHHLSDAELPRLFAELARVAREGLIFQDAVRSSRWRSRLLWALDRGSVLRDEATLLVALCEHFDAEDVQRFDVHHRYLLCRARPRPSPARCGR